MAFRKKKGGKSVGLAALKGNRRSFSENMSKASALHKVAALIQRDNAKALDGEVRDALEGSEMRRALFLKCSGMHTADVQDVIRRICEGSVQGSGLAYVAPALYEGIPDFLNQLTDGLGDLATYSSLYMGLVSAAGFTGMLPTNQRQYGNTFFNGVYASMWMHSAVVFIAVYYRLAAMGHMRESDKLLFLWRARNLPLITAMLFGFATMSACMALMSMLQNTVIENDRCLPVGFDDPSFEWRLWWDEWTGTIATPKGTGVIYPKGAPIMNPWVAKADELGIREGDSDAYGKYVEFMMNHLGLSQPCSVSEAMDRKLYGENYYINESPRYIIYSYVMQFAYMGTWVASFLFLLVWVGPTRHIYNYWAADRSKSFKHYLWAFIGTTSYHFFGPLAADKVEDPFDMTEAFEEFQLRAEVGRVLSLKDEDGGGSVGLDEFKKHEAQLLAGLAEEAAKITGEETGAKSGEKTGEKTENKTDDKTDEKPSSRMDDFDSLLVSDPAPTDGDASLSEMRAFLASVHPALAKYASGFVREMLSPDLLPHLPWASFAAYGVPDGHVALLQRHFLTTGAAALGGGGGALPPSAAIALSAAAAPGGGGGGANPAAERKAASPTKELKVSKEQFFLRRGSGLTNGGKIPTDTEAVHLDLGSTNARGI